MRAAALSLEIGTPMTPGFKALGFKASRGIEDIYALTYIRRKDGSRFPALVSVTALRGSNYTRSLIESNIDALMTTDPQGIISDVSQQMIAALTVRTRDE